jgi:flagellar operon protein
MAAQPIERNPALTPPGVIGTGPAAARRPAAEPVTGFGDVFRQKLAAAGDVRFSGHALQRLQRRGIEVDEATMARLREGIERAASKGSRDSLVLMDGTAFVVSVANRTVITAVDADSMRERVFTNIDSAVIA